MITPRHQKMFLDVLYDRHMLTLHEAIDILMPGKKPNFDHLSQTLNFLWVEDLFAIRRRDAADELWLNKDMLKNADDYVIALKSIEGKDRNTAEQFEPRILEDDIDMFADKHCWVGLKLDGFLKIVGDRDGAANLAERIRSFAQYFACRLVARDFVQVAALFSSVVAQRYSAAELEREMLGHEQEYGSFDFFDHVFTLGVYNGDQADVVVADQMKLPKGIDRAQRRGEARFDLVSVYTPNGMAVHRVMVWLAVIDEGGLLKVCDMRWDRI